MASHKPQWHAVRALNRRHRATVAAGLGALLLVSVVTLAWPERRPELSLLDGSSHRRLNSHHGPGNGRLGGNSCTPPHLNFSTPTLARECFQVEDVCFDQQSVILYGGQYAPDVLDVKPLPNFTVHDMRYDWAGFEGVGGDVYEYGSSLHYPNITFRMRSSLEASEDLLQPEFNSCRMPLIIWQDYPYDYYETIMHSVTRIHMMLADGTMARDLDLVFATPGGQGLAPYHTQLLQPFSRHKVRSFADFSSRVYGMKLKPGGDRAKGEAGRCFKKAVLCKWKNAEFWDAWHAMQWVDNFHRPALRQWGEQSKWGNWRFTSTSTMRVLVSAPQGPVRNFLNARDMVEACNRQKKWHIDKDSRFRRVSCEFVEFSDDLNHNAAAVRGAHALVGVHGPDMANALLMRPGSAMLEILPLNYTECCFPHYKLWPPLLQTNRDAVHYWSISIEDPTAWEPGAFEVRRVAEGDPPLEQDIRDRHVRLHWEGFKDVLERIASVGLLDKKFNEVRAEGENFLALTKDDIMPLKEYQRKKDAGADI